MGKHEHIVTVGRKIEKSYCTGCDALAKVVSIGDIHELERVNLCSKCLAWLKGRLRGF